MTDYKKYDTAAQTVYWNVRLAKDAEVKEFNGDSFTTITFVDSSRNDTDEEMWIGVATNKSQTEICSFLEKGDIIGCRGKLTFRRYGEDKSQVAFNLRNAEIYLLPELIATLKERGFVPGSGNPKGAEDTKPKSKAKGKAAAPVAAKKGPGRPKKVVPIEIDLDDDEAEDEE